MYKRQDVTPLGPKSGKAQYRKSERGREDRKDKRDEKNAKNERGRRSYCRNKVNPVVEKKSDSKVNVY